jgi:hypothetical protein
VSERRAEDPRINQLIADVAEAKVTLTEIRDIMATFRVIAKIAKWLTIIGGAIVAGYHVFDQAVIHHFKK